jgi:hypothetical protein
MVDKALSPINPTPETGDSDENPSIILYHLQS